MTKNKSENGSEVETLRTDSKNLNRGIINVKQKYDKILIRRRTRDDD